MFVFCSSSLIKKVAKPGDILISVNEHVVLDDELQDIMAYIDMLR